ncbi:MAG: pirin family protein [Nitrososphaerota archaeon]|nr:pirin family protein [Nitrososphaerota archaeon]
MIKIISNDQNFKTETDWLISYHHFSFGEHYRPDKTNFGPLRVFNDDIIQPDMGFGFHQHKDMEIITYVTQGRLEHKDSLGNTGTIEAGNIQRMTAGTGVFHSEYNQSKDEPLKLLQIWITPDTKNLKPSWEQKTFSEKDRLDNFFQVIGPANHALKIHQNVEFYISKLTKKAKYQIRLGRQCYLFVIAGNITLNHISMKEKDSAEITNEAELDVQSEHAEIILIDLPQS